MAPRIRVAIAGLSAGAVTSWAAGAHLPYLLSENGQSKYEIVALLNSSTAAAKAAIFTFNLPATVKAYGNAQDWSLDPAVDLVIVNTRVDRHFDIAMPSIQRGKHAFIEYPLAENLARSTELVEALRVRGLSSMTGLQGRVSPVALGLKTLLKQGRIGTVLSSNVQMFANLFARDSFPDGMAYFADRKIGGNPLVISFGQTMDTVHSVLGEFAQDQYHAHAQIQRHQLPILDSDGQVLTTATSDVPDLVSLHGNLDATKRFVAPNASLTAFFRTGPRSFGAPALEWTINGVKGEIRVTCPAGPYMSIYADYSVKSSSPMGPYTAGDALRAPVVLEVQDYETGSVETVDLNWADWQEDLTLRARNIAEVYERFAEKWAAGGVEAEGREVPDMELALLRQRYLEGILEAWDRQTQRK